MRYTTHALHHNLLLAICHMQTQSRELEHAPVKSGWTKAYHHFKEVDWNLA